MARPKEGRREPLDMGGISDRLARNTAVFTWWQAASLVLCVQLTELLQEVVPPDLG